MFPRPKPPDQIALRKRYFLLAAALFCGLWILGLCVETAIVLFNPNEVLGWGERPSLQPDTELGWCLIPSTTTRLRWGGYDYKVTSNSLGFPGPEPSNRLETETTRILVLGGGFSSAEGVDTKRAWPRQLEILLNETKEGRTFEVINFAVTGYGIQQQSILASKFSSRFRPELTILTLAPNDFDKAATPIADQAEGIGFGRPMPNGILSFVTCQHLVWATLRTTRDVVNRVSGRNRYGRAWHLGQLGAFSVDSRSLLEERRDVVGEQIDKILTASSVINSRVVGLLVPSAIQVCRKTDLAYLSDGIDLSDAERWDLEQPQGIYSNLLQTRDVEHFDLRESFVRSDGECPNFPNNLHWTEGGHELVAKYVATSIDW